MSVFLNDPRTRRFLGFLVLCLAAVTFLTHSSIALELQPGGQWDIQFYSTPYDGTGPLPFDEPILTSPSQNSILFLTLGYAAIPGTIDTSVLNVLELSTLFGFLLASVFLGLNARHSDHLPPLDQVIALPPTFADQVVGSTVLLL